MLGILNDDQIEYVLHNQIIGRIGCYAEYKVYVIPVTYVFHGGCIYAHSREGLKIDMMRKNPKVCFEVDSMENMANWRSAIIWGEYEELKTETDQKAGMKILMDRLSPFMTGESAKPSHGLSHPPEIVEKGHKAIVYRIKIKEKTGRYEKTN